VGLDTNPEPAKDADPTRSGFTALVTGIYLDLSVADPDPDPRFNEMTENHKKGRKRFIFIYKKI
jgi:hypothetical protein